MIDTIKICTPIDKSLVTFISSIGDKFVRETKGQLVYEKNFCDIPSYSTSLHLSVDDVHYNLPVLVVEGSPHKIFKMQNAYDGFYDLQEILSLIVNFISKNTSLVLPNDTEKWYLLKVDITRSFNLGSNENVSNYINSLSFLNYPRRKIAFYEGESIYVSGTTNTLKIYNKSAEFRKNDMFKVNKFGTFDVEEHLKKIDGLVRLECSIKQKTLKKICKKNVNLNLLKVNKQDKFIKSECLGLPKLSSIDYSILVDYWQTEFEKLLKLSSISPDSIVYNRNNDVRNIIVNAYGGGKMGNSLYGLFLQIKSDGISKAMKNFSKSTFYRNLSKLKALNIDLSSKIDKNASNFNLFSFPEVY